MPTGKMVFSMEEQMSLIIPDYLKKELEDQKKVSLLRKGMSIRVGKGVYKVTAVRPGGKVTLRFQGESTET